MSLLVLGKLQLYRFPFQVVPAMASRATCPHALTINRLDPLEIRIKRVNMASVQIDEMRWISVFVKNQRAIRNETIDTGQPIADLDLASGTLFLLPARIEVLVRLLTYAHAHRRVPFRPA